MALPARICAAALAVQFKKTILRIADETLGYLQSDLSYRKI
jgi:hypothetical protein